VDRKWRQVPGLLRTRYGRRRLRNSALARSRRLIWPLARLYRRTLIRRTKIIAVVGSFGKTTTTRAVEAALGLPLGKRTGWNAGAFVASGLLRVRPWARYAVLEVGIKRKGQMKGYAKLLRPDIVVVTGIGSEHGTSLETLENTRDEKAAMIRALPSSGLAVLNGDDPNVLWMKECTSARIATFGLGQDNDFRADDFAVDVHAGTQFVLHAGGTLYHVKTRLIGRHMAYAVLAGAAVARQIGMDVHAALARLADLPQTSQRLEVVPIAGEVSLLVDSFKSHLETVNAALQTLADLQAERKIVVMGEVEEPPGSQGPIYRDLGQVLAEVVGHVVFVGGKGQLTPLRVGATEAGLPRSAWAFAGRSPRKAAQLVQEILRPGDVVLIKGRSNQKLLRVALALQGRRVDCDTPSCDSQPGCIECDKLETPTTRSAMSA